MIETLHGLPQDVVFCKKCVMSNQRPASTPEFGKRQMPVGFSSISKPSIGMSDVLNFRNSVIAIVPRMAVGM